MSSVTANCDQLGDLAYLPQGVAKELSYAELHTLLVPALRGRTKRRHLLPRFFKLRVYFSYVAHKSWIPHYCSNRSSQRANEDWDRRYAGSRQHRYHH